MNNNVEAQPQAGSYINPLIISGAGIICSCLALATYHFILFRLCLQSQRELQHITNTTPPHDIPSGVDPEILKKIPILSYSPKKGDAFRLDQSECAICLGELQDGEKLRLLPSCSHAFHIPCIDLWFTQHSNCPICRSTLTITSASSMPVASENDAQERVSHHMPRLQSDHKIASDLSASSSTSQAPHALLQHSLSLAYHTQEKPEDLVTGLKRSLSMDQSSYISVSIQRDEEKASASSPSSSSSAARGIGVTQTKAKSLRQLEQVSSMLMTSFSQFRNGLNERSKGILPN